MIVPFDVASCSAAELALECGGRGDAEGESDRMTVLRCSSRQRATKVWHLDDRGERVCEPYDRIKLWRASTVRVSSLADVARVLGRLEREPTCAVIRGEPLEGVAGTVGRRLAFRDPRTGDPPRFASVPRRWAALDCDKVPLSRAYDLRRPEKAREATRELRAQLPAEFRRAACVAMLTSSAGYGDPTCISARLWFWLDRPTSDEELREWARATSAPVDPALFNPIQLHYTAAPVFVAPLADPIPARIGRLDGDPVAWLGDYRPAPRPAPAPYVPRPRDDAGDDHGRRYARAALEGVARDVASAGEGDRNAALLRGAVRLGRFVPGRWLSREEIIGELRAAARANGDAAERSDTDETITRGIAYGEASPQDPPERGRRAA